MKIVTVFLVASLVFLTFSPSLVHGTEANQRVLLNLATPSTTDVPTRKVELKNRLSVIKDEYKQRVVEKLAERLSMINENWTKHWNNVLERLNMILDKIEARGEALKENGKNTALLTQQINKARTTIETAQDAVDAQAQKQYLLEIASEANLREEVKAKIADFKIDTKAVLATIKSARESVRLALIQVGQLTGEKVEVEEETQ